jgi:hypothetical protein
MTTTNGNRSILDLARWELMCPIPAATVAGAFVISSRGYRQQQMYVRSATEHYMYHPHEDAFILLPSGALGGTFGAGSCGCSTNVGPSGTATAGTTSTLTTNLTLARDLRGYTIHITAGNNAGLTLEILGNTVGANSVITVATQGVTFNNTSAYRLLTPRFFVSNGGTLSGTSFRFYCYALNTWTSNSVTGLPATIATDAKLVSTGSRDLGDYISFGGGTATSGTNNTLTQTGKTWSTNQWTNYQVRIVSGTGAGQIRTIASNTATALTVSSNWTTNPNSTSVYTIEGNDDFLYLLGNGAVTMYRYSISGNSWTTLSPGAARAAAPGVGMGAIWAWNVSTSDWMDESSIHNGRYLYSFRGAATSNLHRYDIPANTWETVSYAPGNETLTTGTSYAYSQDHIYIQKDITNRWFKFNLPRGEMLPWSTQLYPHGATAQLGDRAWDVSFRDGSSDIRWVYYMLNNSTVMLRCPIISPTF